LRGVFLMFIAKRSEQELPSGVIKKYILQ
jgi:hypothetical protein